MTQIPGATVSNPTNTTYQRLAGQFTPPVSGVYYIAIVCDHNTVPYYLSVDDLAINDFPQKDIAVSKVVLRNADSTWTRGASRRHVVQVSIQNIGWENNPTSIPFTYSDGATIVNETVSPVWTGSTGVVTFAAKYIPQNAGSNTITVSTSYAGDANPANNSGFFTSTIQNVKVVGYEDFNQFIVPGYGYYANLTPEPFVATNVNGGATFLTSVGTGIGGSQAVEYPGDFQVANDWLVLPPAYLTAGSSYRFRLQYASQIGLPQNMQFYFGQTPDVTTMQPMVNGTFTNFTNTAFKESGDAATGTYPYFNTTTETNYYIGIKVTSPANSGKLLLDNMLFDVNPAPPPKIGYRYESPATAAYIDDASLAKIDLTVIYHTPGTIDRRYQVTNTTGLFGVNGFMLWNATTTTPWIKLVLDPAGTIPQPNPYSPAWPRENQFFHLIIDPTTLQPGTYNGSITLNAALWNNDRPTSGPGLVASNQPFVIPVNLTVTANGTGGVATPNVVTGTNFGMGPHTMIDGSGNKIATVTVTSGVISSITITEFPNQLPPNYTRLRYVRKYWTIAATGSGWTADVQFYYSDSEALAGGIVNRDNLRGWNQAGKSGWVYAGTSSTSDPSINAVTVFGLNPTNIAGTFACATRWNGAPKSGEGMASTFSLEQNYPNPFNPSTKINFSVPADGLVSLTVYNSMGIEVASLVNEVLETGSYNVNFDASALPAGMYVYRLTAGTSTETRYMSLVK
jgi:hypothetical protein